MTVLSLSSMALGIRQHAPWTRLPSPSKTRRRTSASLLLVLPKRASRAAARVGHGRDEASSPVLPTSSTAESMS